MSTSITRFCKLLIVVFGLVMYGISYPAACAEKPIGSAVVAKPVHGVVPFWADGSDYVCHRATGKIAVDGKLDEPDWSQAGKIVLVIVPGGKEPKTATIARLLYDDKYLYFAAEVEDHDLVDFTNNTHDPRFVRDDITELFVKPETKAAGFLRSGYWEFHALPTGSTRDYYWPQRGYSDEAAMLGESGMKTAVVAEGSINNWHDYDKGYTVEMAIPLSAFAELAPKPKPGDRWHFLVARYDYSAYVEGGIEFSGSAYLKALSFHLYEQYSFLVFGK